MIDRQARRHRLRHLRRGRAAPALDGRLRHLQVGPRGLRPLPADGAGGHRRAGHHRAARPHPDRHGHGLGPRRSPARSSSSGRRGASPATRTSCDRPAWPRPSWPAVGLPPGHPRHHHRTAARSTASVPTRTTRESHDHRGGPQAAAPGVGRRGGERPPGGAPGRPHRAHAPGPGRVRRRGRVPAGPAGRRPVDRGRGQRVLLPGPRGGPRPGRGLPVHDPGLR